MSLLSHLLAGSEKEEVYATSALTYLLGREAHYRDALVADWASLTGTALPAGLSFRSEARAGDGWCDVAGLDNMGQTHLLVEGKFWAALTDNQPGSYLDGLSDSTTSGMLIFVAPAIRFETLWPELLRRAQASGHEIAGSAQGMSDLRFARLASGNTLALTSWTALLNRLEAAGSRAGDADFVSDVRQLAALCERMDSTSFLPLKASELTSAIGRRHIQLRLLLGELQKTLFTEEVATRNPGTVKSSEWWPLLLNEKRAYLRFWVQGWAAHRETPCWLAFPKVGDLLLDEPQRSKLGRLAHEEPSRLVDDTDYWMVPLYPLLAAERHDVLTDLLGQVRKVAALLI
ncbi:hypothetical protein LA345_13135 [Burkholderia vietnamiensis]|uniref:PD-(D/E)XK nuclease superfamily protein n=1 Tax=Burkholderia vietnamiensis (strain G4 / LMG 22486) TaxID=269482 RepID=A4JFP2_BURVG|nr:hypothetical protein Bcep1808_2093 [Burkholderia vietnamiensis G4]MCB4344857.1 hypothetical protein [Burkholderia vietnamiensis]